MVETLEDAIVVALNDWFDDHAVGEDAQGEVKHIAAAVIAHLASPEVVERAGLAVERVMEEWESDEARSLRMMGRKTLGELAADFRGIVARAALAAAVGGEESK